MSSPHTLKTPHAPKHMRHSFYLLDILFIGAVPAHFILSISIIFLIGAITPHSIGINARSKMNANTLAMYDNFLPFNIARSFNHAVSINVLTFLTGVLAITALVALTAPLLTNSHILLPRLVFIFTSYLRFLDCHQFI